MNPALIPFAFMLAGFAVMAAFFAPLIWPGLYRAEPRRTIERLCSTIRWASPKYSEMTLALRMIELAASSGHDVARAASDALVLFERRKALIDSWGERLGRFTEKEGDPALLGYMPDLPTGTTPQDRVDRAKAWISVIPRPASAAIALSSARFAMQEGVDPTPALAEARNILARNALSLELALDELRAIR